MQLTAAVHATMQQGKGAGIQEARARKFVTLKDEVLKANREGRDLAQTLDELGIVVP